MSVESHKNLTLIPTIGSIDSYISYINGLPMLSPEEELALAKRWHYQQDLEAARKLVMAHLRVVVKLARKYSGYGLPLADLIQEGNIGLMKAVKKFDPNKGVRLISFAIQWIKAELHEFIIKNWRIVKIATTKAQRKLFFNLRSSKKSLDWLNAQETKDLAKSLDVKEQEVKHMEMRFNAYDTAFDAPTSHDDADNDFSAPANFLGDLKFSPESCLEKEQWQQKVAEKLQAGIQLLKPRERDILSQRWLQEEKVSLQDLAKTHNVSLERIRQIEKAAIEKLQQYFVQHKLIENE